MRDWVLRACTLLSLGAAALYAQAISGDWQGILKVGPEQTRHILHVVKNQDGGWNAKLSNVDQTHDWGLSIPVSSFTVSGSDLRFAVDRLHVTYEGKVSADRATIVGTWTQGQPQPLEFKRATSGTAWHDPSPHRTRFINTAKNVNLEVLDWGGPGHPLVLLTGQGNTAHIFDHFALKLNTAWHVYGITRRGYGASSTSESVCEADCLADNVLTIIGALDLDRPVLAGHSIAGQELTSIGLRHPEQISGLIYLDAAYDYALPAASLTAGVRNGNGIPVPILAIFPVPHSPPPGIGKDSASIAAFEARDEAAVGAQAKRFKAAISSARIVRLRRADHYLFLSNETDVVREVNAFLNGLSRP